MPSKKKPNEKGKQKLSRMFQEFKEGEKVAVSIELSVPFSLPKRLQGDTGIVTGKRGKAYIVKINDNGKYKDYLIKPVHLKRINKK
jgi:large subunit ribosomal protein L21e